jgi:hypothetical protein
VLKEEKRNWMSEKQQALCGRFHDGIKIHKLTKNVTKFKTNVNSNKKNAKTE